MLFAIENHHPQVHPSAYIAPTGVVIGRVELSAGVSIWFNAVLRGDINSITVGRDTNIQDGCILHVTNVYPVIMGERITVGHGAILHGCHVKSDCLISMAAVILDGAVIGERSVIAAGAVVAPGTQVPADSLVMGVPGKVVRKLDDAERQKILDDGWKHYADNIAVYRESLIALTTEPPAK
jgi:carbonic anhydrase/acetyltransferase-like protein (isoleucine patch superfamily)